MFVLEKGTEYEFGTWPFCEDVGYNAQDDMAADAPLLTDRRGGGGSPGEWTIDGGLNWLFIPCVSGGVYHNGVCGWLPTLQGSPDVRHLGPDDFPVTFSAIVTDCPNQDSLTFMWGTSDVNIHIRSPFSRETQVSVGAMPSWNTFDLYVSTIIGDHYLESRLGSAAYGTNDCPQVRLSLNVARGIPHKKPRLPVGFNFECDTETNGWLVVECDSSTNRVSVWQSATNGTAYVCSNRIDHAKSSSGLFFAQGDVRSSDYEDVVWRLKFLSDSGQTNVITRASTVFGCYCQPVMEARINGGSAFYNPCQIQLGSNAWFRADLVPRTIPAGSIRWRGEGGTLELSDNLSGRKIQVEGAAVGDAILELSVLDYTDERMRFETEVVE